MQTKPDLPPILSKFQKRVYEAPANAEIVSCELTISEPDSTGYNPYDNAGPVPDEQQLDVRLNGRGRPRRR